MSDKTQAPDEAESVNKTTGTEEYSINKSITIEFRKLRSAEYDQYKSIKFISAYAGSVIFIVALLTMYFLTAEKMHIYFVNVLEIAWRNISATIVLIIVSLICFICAIRTYARSFFIATFFYLDLFYDDAFKFIYKKIKSAILLFIVILSPLILYFTYDLTLIAIRQIGYMEAIKHACRSVAPPETKGPFHINRQTPTHSGNSTTEGDSEVNFFGLVDSIYRGVADGKSVTCALKKFFDGQWAYEINSFEKDAADIIKSAPKNERKSDGIAAFFTGETEKNDSTSYIGYVTRAISYTSNYHGGNLIGLDVKNGVFADSDFSRGVFKLANLQNSVFSNVTLNDAIFSCSNLSGAKFFSIERATTRKASKTTNFSGVYGVGSAFPINMHDDKIDFAHANLSCSKITNAENSDARKLKYERAVFDYARIIKGANPEKYSADDVVCGQSSTGKCNPLNPQISIEEWEKTCNKLKKKQEKRGVKLCNPFIDLNENNMADTTCWIKGPNEIECTEKRPDTPPCQSPPKKTEGECVAPSPDPSQPAPANPPTPPPTPAVPSPAADMGGGG